MGARYISYAPSTTIELHHDLINLIWYLCPTRNDSNVSFMLYLYFFFFWGKNIQSDGFIAEIRTNDRSVSQFGLIHTEATFVYRTHIKSERKYFFFYILYIIIILRVGQWRAKSESCEIHFVCAIFFLNIYNSS